ncbi:molybdopterin-dependent oxidoreductase [Microbispora sp. H13382]|uniref:molybdopterin-dependent oxidoreductase n=1 Tax=Microbispora sp. H13382 TaxID=2729112 RepID=UPI0015FF11E8|nr:molybdopterin-dependent oxidoreductase [Microbispora sp. H13382]
MDVYGFPAWLRVEHWINALFITLMVRSGIEILATHPKLYGRDDSRPGSEWARFTRKTMPKDKLYDTLDEEESYSPIISLPGHRNLGMGRHWHFFVAIGWVLAGVTYVALLFATGQWRRYIPTSWGILPQAWHDLLTYLSFRLPPHLPGEPFDALQKLAYALVIFVLAPVAILSGLAQSPAVDARFPWFLRLWGGRQRVRSLHFFVLLAFLAFTAVHLLMLAVWGWGRENSLMIFGHGDAPVGGLWVSLVIIAAIIGVNIAVTVWSLRRPRMVQRVLGAVVMALRRALLRPATSHQHYPKAAVAAQHRVNGKPPDSDTYKIMAVHDFAPWRLTVGGLVENPVVLTLEDLRALNTRQSQCVLHHCIQGWSSVGEWTGLPLRDLLDLVRPLPEARYICFLTMQDNGRDEPSAPGEGHFYEIIDLELAHHPQTLLAYEMNGEPLPIEHGAPLRLRLENQLGFKMAKWIHDIEFLSDYRLVGDGMGGWREDNVHFDMEVGI